MKWEYLQWAFRYFLCFTQGQLGSVMPALLRSSSILVTKGPEQYLRHLQLMGTKMALRHWLYNNDSVIYIMNVHTVTLLLTSYKFPNYSGFLQ